ncbi:MAG: hypothetical protein VX988_01855 [Planctomycetota bacterium]|nr:hypothetical protein [Planctomycetota bacterium]
MSIYSELLNDPHPLDAAAANATNATARLAELLGIDATSASSPAEASPLTPAQAQQYWPDHRQNLLQIIQQHAEAVPDTTSICIVGAGRCLDLDLQAIMQAGYTDILLVDIDRRGIYEALEAVEQASADAAQTESDDDGTVKVELSHDDNSIRLVAKPLDATGMIDGMAEWESHYLNEMAELVRQNRTAEEVFQQLEQWLEHAANIESWIEEQPGYDLVLSDCILTQMVSSMLTMLMVSLFGILQQVDRNRGVGAFVRILQNMVERHVIRNHIDILSHLSAPHGVAHMIADTVALERRRFKSKQEVPPQYATIFDDGKSVICQRPTPRLGTGQASLQQCVQNALPEEQRNLVETTGRWLWLRQPDELQAIADNFQTARSYYAEEVQAVYFFPSAGEPPNE